MFRFPWIAVTSTSAQKDRFRLLLTTCDVATKETVVMVATKAAERDRIIDTLYRRVLTTKWNVSLLKAAGGSGSKSHNLIRLVLRLR